MLSVLGLPCAKADTDSFPFEPFYVAATRPLERYKEEDTMKWLVNTSHYLVELDPFSAPVAVFRQFEFQVCSFCSSSLL